MEFHICQRVFVLRLSNGKSGNKNREKLHTYDNHFCKCIHYIIILYNIKISVYQRYDKKKFLWHIDHRPRMTIDSIAVHFSCSIIHLNKDHYLFTDIYQHRSNVSNTYEWKIIIYKMCNLKTLRICKLRKKQIHK